MERLNYENSMEINYSHALGSGKANPFLHLNTINHCPSNSNFEASNEIEDSAQCCENITESTLPQSPISNSSAKVFPSLSFNEFIKHFDLETKFDLKDLAIICQFDKEVKKSSFTFYHFKLIDVRQFSTGQSLFEQDHYAHNVQTLTNSGKRAEFLKKRFDDQLFTLFNFKAVTKNNDKTNESYSYYDFTASPIVKSNIKKFMALNKKRSEQLKEELGNTPIDFFPTPNSKKVNHE